ncbi:ectoine/hydroxyectoine ABC transporter permease subunit EhuD [Streptomyces alfalfae]|uniref:Ectoine/hydroxyectoine ABC transporter permease subunit EhuD n=1 Tax=Streptomyces alfalfae TaxID=1642299 RepID=A0ABN4VNN4_9ACTN|nr:MULTISPECIES: ectoine/hydroxyectoine ABC transporter permease subunit EhuD [Streptomyces]AYA18519.1 ectoine/hydroxyectoine ABC transporter permease subunit EhuD [Streptomyces fradiae]APY88134.1 ectoine/hydroxyectoine ABC transporter permease subunit EhuD [Streptomyces alfalfae]KUL52152.1 ectoine/hydroxyectoine ABC transporter permease subunit EhuD [Streptomyces sp. NRRL S-1521]QUI31890.1 ectoine/hydroxyectoine ABC transporter permease subunit EhuD [Streptomyces alfalfae]RXX46600.1 ectoine/h
MNWNWSHVDDFMPLFWDGVELTLKALLFGTLIAFSLGLVWAIAQRSEKKWIRWPVTVVTEFIRNTPLLVQLFFLFYVVPEWGPSMSPLTTGVVGLGLHYSTYTSEVYRAGIEGVPAGQWEAATALSLSKRRTWTSVILPQAVRRVIPALGNYVIVMLKESPQMAAIGALDMLGQAQGYSQATFTYEAISVVGVAFIVIAYPASLLLRALERRLVR